MCGRYSNKYDGRKLVIRYHAENRNFQSLPSQNIAPTQLAPVVIFDGEKRLLKAMKWGLIPSWAKDVRAGVKCFNARAETAADKPTFRSSFKSRRCLIPVDAFYEWREEVELRRVTIAEHKNDGVKANQLPTGRKVKRPYRFKVVGEEIFSLAGLWSIWGNPKGEEIESFTILTTEPNSLLAQYHNRMPVILPRDKEQVWVDSGFSNTVLLQGMLRPFPSELMNVDSVQKDTFER